MPYSKKSNHLVISKALTKKCIASTVRNSSNIILLVTSAVLVFVVLVFIWAMTRGQYEVYMSSQGNFDKLHFRLQCNSTTGSSVFSLSSCVALNKETAEKGKIHGPDNSDTAATNVLLNLLQPDLGPDADSSQSSYQSTIAFANMIGSTLLNGLPILGLDDWFTLSDFMNANMNSQMRSDMMRFTSLKGRFLNLLDARNMKLVFTPDNCWTGHLIKHLNTSTTTFRSLQYEVVDSMNEALSGDISDVWAVIEIISPSASANSTRKGCGQIKLNSRAQAKLVEEEDKKDIDVEGLIRPAVTIRMHPISVPDTRSYRWTPRKDNPLDPMSTGQLLYYTSGFLTLQLEIQNFFSTTFIGGVMINRDVLNEPKQRLNEQLQFVKDIINGTITNRSSPGANIIQQILSSPQSQFRMLSASIDSPLFLRALPLPPYHQNLYWHQFGDILTTCLIILFCVPAALVAGRFSKEIMEGHIEILSTLPGVRVAHSALAWCTCSAMIVVMFSTGCCLFFSLTAFGTDPLLPTISLLLLGFALAPISTVISMLVKNSQVVVVAIPTVTLVMMLPGLLYVDLAFDVQRSIASELFLCLSPASAAALVIRQFCSFQAIGDEISWNTKSPVARTPLYCYVLMQLLDVVLYLVLMIVVAEVVNTVPSRNQIYTGKGEDVENANDEIIVSNVSKQFNSPEKSIPVLSSISGKLRVGTVTTLLGSNGAGKSTLMRILAGLDPNFDGVVQYPYPGCDWDRMANEVMSPAGYYERHRQTEYSRRLVGWCPQQDALFDFLTVSEHLKLFSDLLGSILFNYLDNEEQKEVEFDRILKNLGLLDKKNSRAFALSGGMKRRLSLALASLGEPMILILDEPTSGCDNLTRERVRQWILARRCDSAILVSTHHVDDISIVSDRVWYLNDRFLKFDGPIATVDEIHLRKLRTLLPPAPATTKPAMGKSKTGKRVKFLDFDISWGQKTLDFTMNTSEIVSKFKRAITRDSTATAYWGQDGCDLVLEQTASQRAACVTVPGQLNTFLFNFVQNLEGAGYNDWSVRTPNIFEAIVYAAESDIDKQQKKLTLPEEPVMTHASGENAEVLKFVSYFGTNLQHVLSIIRLRWTEIKAHWVFFLAAYVIIPFLVVWVITVSCSDHSYPKIELASSRPSLESFGKIFSSSGALHRVESGLKSHWVLGDSSESSEVGDQSRLEDDLYKVLFPGSKSNKTIPGAKIGIVEEEENALVSVFGSLLRWKGSKDSNELRTHLFQHFWDHKGSIWGAIVADDKIDGFFDSTVYIPESALDISPESIFQFASALHHKLCNLSSTHEPKTHDENIVHEYWNVEKSLFFCGSEPTTRLGVARGSNFGAGMNNSALVITLYTSLESNITLLCNTTAYHAAPIFLKEVVTAAYSALQKPAGADYNSSSVKHPKYNKKEKRGVEMRFSGSPQYDLYSHPFPEVNLTNEAYMWRGYLGASMLLLLMLISTMISVRFITHLRKSGTKHLLHLSGVTIPSYWIGNYICDSVTVFCILLSAYAAIFVGGAPIQSFFFRLPPAPGLLFFLLILFFSPAIVASNYAFCSLSSDELVSELSCAFLSILVGICLKLYMRLHGPEHYELLSLLLKLVSPSFVFTSALFDMFGQYANNIGKSAGVLYIINCPGLLGSVIIDLLIMFCQSILYLFCAMALDMYWVKLKIGWNSGQCFADVYRKTVDRLSHLFDRARGRLRSVSAQFGLLERYDYSVYIDRLNFSAISPDGSDIDIEEQYGDVFAEPTETTSLLATTSNDDAMEEVEPIPQSSYGAIRDRSSSELKLSSFIHAESSDTIYRMEPVWEVIPENPVVKVEDLVVSYAWNEAPALASISFTMNPGDRIALVGVNGGGKSTMYRILSSATTDVPTSGSAKIMGIDIVYDDWSAFANRYVGYVPQESELIGFMTVKEILDLFSALKPQHDNVTQTYGTSDILKIIDKKYLSYPVKALSGGSKKKLAMILANMHRPKVLLMDEPTTGIDPDAAQKVLKFLNSNLDPHQALLFTSHRVDECLRTCDKIIVLREGKVTFNGPIKQFYKMSSEFYMVDVAVYTNSSEDIVGTTSFLAAIRGEIISKLQNSNPAKRTTKVFVNSIVYCPGQLRIMGQKSLVPMTVFWTVLEELQSSKQIKHYDFRDIGMEEVLSILISESYVKLDT